MAITPIPGPDGRPEQLIAVSRDVTEQRAAEEALREADRRKDEFLATLAHELRNPLAPIRTGLQVLKLRPGGEPADKARSMMERQLGHMVRLIDDLLDISRVSRGKVELRRKLVTVQSVVDSAVGASRPAIEEAGHHFAVHTPDEPLYLDADSTRLAQVLSNLLNNAAKYTPAGGHQLRAVALVALTGWGSEADKNLTTDAGFDAHLTKPAAPTELQTLLSELPTRAVLA